MKKNHDNIKQKSHDQRSTWHKCNSQQCFSTIKSHYKETIENIIKFKYMIKTFATSRQKKEINVIMQRNNERWKSREFVSLIASRCSRHSFKIWFDLFFFSFLSFRSKIDIISATVTWESLNEATSSIFLIFLSRSLCFFHSNQCQRHE